MHSSCTFSACLHFSQLCAISLSFAQNLCIIAFLDPHLTEFVHHQNLCIRLTSNDASCEFVHHHITGQLNLALFLHAAQFRKESIVIVRFNPFTKYFSSSFALHELVISLAYLMRLLYALSMTFPLEFQPAETHTSQILRKIFTCPVIHFLLRAQQQKNVFALSKLDNKVAAPLGHSQCNCELGAAAGFTLKSRFW